MAVEFQRGDRVRVTGSDDLAGHIAGHIDPGLVVIDLTDGDRIAYAADQIEHLD